MLLKNLIPMVFYYLTIIGITQKHEDATFQPQAKECATYTHRNSCFGAQGTHKRFLNQMFHVIRVLKSVVARLALDA